MSARLMLMFLCIRRFKCKITISHKKINDTQKQMTVDTWNFHQMTILVFSIKWYKFIAKYFKPELFIDISKCSVFFY